MSSLQSHGRHAREEWEEEDGAAFMLSHVSTWCLQYLKTKKKQMVFQPSLYWFCLGASGRRRRSLKVVQYWWRRLQPVSVNQDSTTIHSLLFDINFNLLVNPNFHHFGYFHCILCHKTRTLRVSTSAVHKVSTSSYWTDMKPNAFCSRVCEPLPDSAVNCDVSNHFYNLK